MSDASLTIVVPLFNGRAFLDQLLPSLRAQEAAVERYLFVDDASTDGSLEHVRAFGLRSAEYVVNETNLGLYGTLNRALTMVRTALVALVFQDDLLLEDYAAAMRLLAARRPEVSFFAAGCARLDAAGTPIHAPCRTSREWTQTRGEASWRGVLLKGTSWIISGSVSRTAALQAYGFRADLPQCADFEFFIRAARADAFVYFDRTLVAIREHPAQASAGNLARSIDLAERILIFKEQRRRWPGDFGVALRLGLLRRYGYYVAARAFGQLRRGRWRMSLYTASLLLRLLDALWGG